MKKILNSLTICMFIISCGRKNGDSLQQLGQQIITTDIAMSDLAAKDGFNTSLLAYADRNLVKLGEGKLPIIGKAAFAASFDKTNDPKSISWSPVSAEVAESGELGYTWGNWKFITKDTIYYGNYFTIWKKQTDGSWKMALDGGNNSPNPNH